MDLFNKAKEAISGGDSSSSKNKKKDSSIFSKAMEAAEKYHAKEKVAEFAQKRVAKREEEKRQPGRTSEDFGSYKDDSTRTAVNVNVKVEGQTRGVYGPSAYDDRNEYSRRTYESDSNFRNYSSR